MTAATNVTTGDLAIVKPNHDLPQLVDRIVTVGERLYGGETIEVFPGVMAEYDRANIPADVVVWLVRLQPGAAVPINVELIDRHGQSAGPGRVMQSFFGVRDMHLRRIAGPGVPLPAEDLAAPGPGERPVEQASGIGTIECSVPFPFVGVPA